MDKLPEKPFIKINADLTKGASIQNEIKESLDKAMLAELERKASLPIPYGTPLMMEDLENIVADLRKKSFPSTFFERPFSTATIRLWSNPIREKIERAIEYHKKQREGVEAVVLKEELFADWLEAFKDKFDSLSLAAIKKSQAFFLSGSDIAYTFAPFQTEDFYTFQSEHSARNYTEKLLGRLDAEEQLKRRRFLSVDDAAGLGFSVEESLAVIAPGARLFTRRYQLQPAKWLDKYEYWHYVEV